MQVEYNNLIRKVAMPNLVSNENGVFAAGPITLQPHSRPYRIVMVDWGNQISVHQEFFEVNADEVLADNNTTDLADACQAAKSYFENGQYFKLTELAQAQRIFADKLDHHCQFVQTVYREEALAMANRKQD